LNRYSLFADFFSTRSLRFSGSLLTALLILCALTLVLPAVARADTQYSYMGQYLQQDLSGCGGPCGFSPPYSPMTDYVSGYFTVASPLGANMGTSGAPVDITALVTSFSFSDGVMTYTNNTPGITDTIQVATDNFGAISFWDVFVEIPTGDAILSCASYTAQCLGPGFGGFGDETFDNGAVGLYVTPATGPGGTWSVPEPSSIILLGSGLLGIVGIRRRKLSV